MNLSDTICCVMFGIAGALIGYGHSEILTAACTGGGIGLVILPVSHIVFGIFGG